MELPDPPLRDVEAGILLRPWTESGRDVEALVSSWADPEVAGSASVPEDASSEGAKRWIRSSATRRASDLALDLVVGPFDRMEVWGEVGLTRLRLRTPTDGDAGLRELSVWDLGWWIRSEHRGRGVATAAVRLLVVWALEAAGIERLPVVARIERHNRASQAVARHAGFAHRGNYNATHDLWLATR